MTGVQTCALPIYGEPQVDELIRELQRADLVVGFNVVRFDYEVLHGYTVFDLTQLPTLDMLTVVTEKLKHRLALDSIAFRPRVLRNVSKIDPGSEILGKKLRIPVLLAPVGSLESFEPGGGITVARGAGAGNVGMLISSVTTLRLQDIVKGGNGPKIYQLYVRGDDA